MIFDAHLHLPRTQVDVSFSSEFGGGLAISRSTNENLSYIKTTRKLGLRCAVFVGESQRHLDQLVRWIELGWASAYAHVELLEHFDSKVLSPFCHASLRAGTPIVVHLSHHDHKRTAPTLVASCVDYLTENFPSLKVIVAHLAGENFSVALSRMEPNPNLFFDISRLAETADRAGRSSPRDLLKLLSETIPPTRIIFGTDQVGMWDPTSSIEYASVRHVFSDVESDQVLAGNALSLFSQTVLT